MKKPPAIIDEIMRRMEALQNDPEHRRKSAEAERKRSEAASADLTRRKREFVDNLQLPEHHVQQMESLRPTKALEAVMADVPGILVLSGGVGCGKTMAAVWWLYAFATASANWETGETPRFKPKRKPYFSTAAAVARWPRYDSDVMEARMGSPRLVIDDLGKEYLDANGSYLATLEEIIDARYSRRLPLVMTTNMTAAAFRERYTARIADRINEVGSFLSINAPSMRRTT